MKSLNITIKNVQQLTQLHFELDLTLPKITCITGRNGTGKTTLVKAMRTLASADTFTKTTVRGVFGENSSIIYVIDELQIEFLYNPDLGIVDSKQLIPEWIRKSILAELPLPFGDRFNFFQRISGADDEIRRAIILQEYGDPKELKQFLWNIYGSQKFDRLVEVVGKGTSYYCILLDDDRYIREDYLSSGEYFVIALFRQMSAGRKLVVIDELDISLDAAAQVQLVGQLRYLCQKYGSSIVFTTHSMALMRKLDPSELYYIDSAGVDGHHNISCLSFNHVNSLLFGFKGSDKYLLTEDSMLAEYVRHLIAGLGVPLFFSYKVIFIGSANDVASLLRRNSDEQFFAPPEDVIAVLDGDKSHTRLSQVEGISFLPFPSVEKAFLIAVLRGDIKIDAGQLFTDKKTLDQLREYVQLNGREATLTEGQFGKIAKNFMRWVCSEKKLLSIGQIFTALTDIHGESTESLRTTLSKFLCQPPLSTPKASVPSVAGE